MNVYELLAAHFRSHPQMEFADAVKFIYQSEFGGGHMISDEQASEAWLKNEIDRLKSAKRKADPEVYEELGNGMCRLSLNCIDFLSVFVINRMFVLTARQKRGDRDTFSKKLSEFRRLCGDGTFPLRPEGLEQWEKAGFPPVSHSQKYRDLYNPAYRLVKKEYVSLLGVFAAVESALKTRGRAVVAIDGQSASGKTSAAGLLSEIYGASVIHMDDFFLRPEQRTAERLAECGGNVDRERFTKEVALKLEARRDFSYRVFDCSVLDFSGSVQVKNSEVVIVEGAYCLRPEWRRLYDVKVMMKIGASDQRERIKLRNGEKLLERFEREWIPAENRYLTETAAEKICDVVLEAFK